MRLSKSRFTSGLQCHRLLWWRVHEPDAPELVPDVAGQAILDQGTRVGELARTYVPGGRLVDLPHDAWDERLDLTRRLLADRVPAIYEASFSAGDVYAAVDILERGPDGHHLVEVKSSTRVKEEHVPDVAVQFYVLGLCGVQVSRAELMHLNRACTYPDLSDLFVREDVSKAAAAWQPGLPTRIADQVRMLAGPLPDVAVGAHCHKPRACPFLGRCWAEVPRTHVGTLYRVRDGGADLLARGYRTIEELPDGLGLSAIQERQRRAVRTGQLVVEPGLGRALGVLHAPLAFLDFETIALAVPVWDGCHPYDAVPAQFSCHRPRSDGSLDHHEWLAEGPEDPRPEIARRVVAACRGARGVVAYNAGFERRCLEHL
ncbi:MAG: DUF2779 domain-containing protein, partial [Deltaproteobacteria bacterium]|nr:DUF2779 domain-containing protein [Deltaproteobacteria bacterium]